MDKRLSIISGEYFFFKIVISIYHKTSKGHLGSGNLKKTPGEETPGAETNTQYKNERKGPYLNNTLTLFDLDKGNDNLNDAITFYENSQLLYNMLRLYQPESRVVKGFV